MLPCPSGKPDGDRLGDLSNSRGKLFPAQLVLKSLPSRSRIQDRAASPFSPQGFLPGHLERIIQCVICPYLNNSLIAGRAPETPVVLRGELKEGDLPGCSHRFPAQVFRDSARGEVMLQPPGVLEDSTPARG